MTLLYDVRLEYDWIIKLQTIEVKEKEGNKTRQTTRRTSLRFGNYDSKD